MKKLSVKLRITLWYTLAMIIVSGIVLVSVSSFSKNMISRDVQARLARVVDEFPMGPAGKHPQKNNDGNKPSAPTPEHRFYDSGVHIILYDSEGNIVNGVMPFDIDDALDVTRNGVHLTTYDGDKYYEYIKRVQLENETFYVRGITAVSDELYVVKSIVKTNTVITVITILLAAIGGYFIIHNAFKPVKKITETAKSISNSGDLSRRIAIGEGKDEIYSLANVFDEMLEKLKNTFDREKQFTSDASHELRTPVAVILSECEYAEQCAKTEVEYKESVGSIKRQAERMSKLISELLTISRMDRNAIETNFETVNLSELVCFVCDEQEEINDSTVNLVRNIDTDIVAMADTFLYTRLCINLISNAYGYIGDGNKITVSLKDDGENVILEVSDNGIGISQENLSKIWERFYQVDPSRTNTGNMGLGLSMVKWIAACHKGSIEVTSELGKGSTFTFIMPKER